MNVLIAPDKFKGSLTALEVCKAIALGLNQRENSYKFVFHPMADGGDDSLAVLSDHLELIAEKIISSDPLGRAISCKYFTSSDAAFIEVASASGLVLLKGSERNPMRTSTLGTGKILASAISKGFKNIFLFLGGSATNDAGMGIANALGFQFLDENNNELLPIGESLSKVNNIVDNHLFDFSEINLTLFYDVNNPLFGQNGAAYVYAPQKGASPEQVKYLDEGLKHFSEILKGQTGMDVGEISGAGAAGGIGAGLVGLCGAKMGKGFDVISKLTNLEQKIQAADWVISGEGKLDGQSLQGKVVDGIAELCKKHRKPLTLFVGKNDLGAKAMKDLQVNQILSITSLSKNEKDAMLNAKSYLKTLAKNISLV